MTYPLVDECLYSTHFWTVTCLVTSPITEEFRILGGNFHNCYGSYIIWARPKLAWGETSRMQEGRPSISLDG